MIRGVFSCSDTEVRVKLLHRPFGAAALAGAWTAADRWFVEKTFSGDTLLLGVESDRDTRRMLAVRMRGDLAITAVPGGLFRDRVREIVDFDQPLAELAKGPAYGVFWTMAAGFGPAFRARLAALAQRASPGDTFSNLLHDGDFPGQDGPDVVFTGTISMTRHACGCAPRCGMPFRRRRRARCAWAGCRWNMSALTARPMTLGRASP